MTWRDALKLGGVVSVIAGLHLVALFAYYPRGVDAGRAHEYEANATAQRREIIRTCEMSRADLLATQATLLQTQALMTAVDQSLSDRTGWRKRTSDTLGRLVSQCQGTPCPKPTCPRCSCPDVVCPACPSRLRWPWE